MEHSDWLINNYNIRNNRVPQLTKNLNIVRNGPLIWADSFQALERGRYTKQLQIVLCILLIWNIFALAYFFTKLKNTRSWKYIPNSTRSTITYTNN